MDAIWSHIGITASGALGVVVATVVLYVVLVLVMEVSGPRLMASPSVLSWALMALIGAMSARAMLGDFPTLGGAAVALTTLLVLERVLGRLLHSPDETSGRWHGTRPAVVMVDGETVAENLLRRRLSEGQLRTLLRRAGITHVPDAAVVVLESRGTITVVRDGERIDAALVEGVRGAELIPEHALAL